jgi:hypothetical protein
MGPILTLDVRIYIFGMEIHSIGNNLFLLIFFTHKSLLFFLVLFDIRGAK